MNRFHVSNSSNDCKIDDTSSTLRSTYLAPHVGHPGAPINRVLQAQWKASVPPIAYKRGDADVAFNTAALCLREE